MLLPTTFCVVNTFRLRHDFQISYKKPTMFCGLELIFRGCSDFKIGVITETCCWLSIIAVNNTKYWKIVELPLTHINYCWLNMWINQQLIESALINWIKYCWYITFSYEVKTAIKKEIEILIFPCVFIICLIVLCPLHANICCLFTNMVF